MGETDLNLSDYAENEFRYYKLALKNCADPDAYIEVGLRGVVAKEKKESTPKNNSMSLRDNEVNMEQLN